jgi:hypothetical protein
MRPYLRGRPLAVDIDQRGFRVAVLADEYVNPRPDSFDALEVLRDEDWGAIQLPPVWYSDAVAAPLLEQVAEHVEEFARHGYDVVLVGGRDGLREALQQVGARELEPLHPATAEDLRGFLRARAPVNPAVARGEINS